MDQSYHYLLMVNQAVMQKQLLSGLKETNLTMGQPKVLDFLRDHDGVTQREIAQGCHIEAASLTSVLNGMEAKGLLQRRTVEGNRRAYHIFLTEEGWNMQREVERVFLNQEERAFRGISEEEKDVFLKVFQKIYDNLSEEQK